MKEDKCAGAWPQALFPLGWPQREPNYNLQGAQVSPALLSATSTSLQMQCPVAWHGGEQPLAWSDPCSGLHPGLLAHFPLASAGGPPARAATREGREAREPRQTGPATWSTGLSWDGSVLGGKWEGGDHSWWEDVGGGSADRGWNSGTLWPQEPRSPSWQGATLLHR